MPEPSPLIFYSNRLEVLLEELKARLFAGSGPFANRWVVVPTPAMKSWIQHCLATDPKIGIAAGIRFLFLEEAVAELAGGTVPSVDELALRIESLLRRDRRFTEVERFVETNPKRRYPALSRQLADHFVQYGLYGSRMVAIWQDEGWQQRLWSELFSDELPQWSELLKEVGKGPDQLHLFGFSHLPPLFYRFLRQLDPTLYVLSPCLAFWTDLRSDRESRSLLRSWTAKGAKEGQVEELAGYLRSRNRLLANFGRLGRQLVSLLEDEVAVEEHRVAGGVRSCPQYQDLLSDEVQLEGDGSLSMLQAVQADLLLLRNPAECEPVAVATTDRTIAIHAAPSKLREVEVVHQHLREALAELQAHPSDVVVMAPNIGDYAPLIRGIFGDELRCSIQDLTAPPPDSLESSIELLVALGLSRWELSKVLELFAHPLFARHHQLSLDDLRTIERLFQETRIRWGINTAHRESCLSERYGGASLIEPHPASTWEEGFRRLLISLARGDDPPFIELGSAELLEKVMSLFDGLVEVLEPLASGEMRTLAQWCDHFDQLCEHFLGSEFPHLRKLRRLAARLGEEQFPFSSVQPVICRWETGVTRAHDLEAVRSCSLVPMRAIPAKIVCLIGMHEGAFPRASAKQPLNLLTTSPDADPYPSRSDFDRYLFLEALLSARERFLITYPDVNEEDGQPQGPSLLVAELQSYLDQAVSSSLAVQHHPELSCHPSYLGPNNYATNRTYQRAQAAYQASTQLTPWSVAVRDSEPTVRLRDLRLVTRDPIRLFLRESLGVYLATPESLKANDQERLRLDPLERHQLMATPLDTIPNWLLPPAPFRELALQDLRRRQEESAEQPFSVELSRAHAAPGWIETGRFGFPAIELDGVVIEGELSLLLPEGDLASRIRLLPDYAVYSLIADQLPGEHEGLPQEAARKQLAKLLAYYKLCCQKPITLSARRLARVLKGQDPMGESRAERWWLQVGVESRIESQILRETFEEVLK